MRILKKPLHCVLAVLLLLAGPAVAQTKGNEFVTVYTSREPEFVEPLLRVFEQLTRIKLDLVYVKDGIAQRVAGEGENGPADLILASEFTQLIDAKALNATQPVSLKVLNESVPASYKDSEGHWFGLSRRARIALVSRERVKLDAVTYEDFADPKWKGRICVRSGRHPYNIGLLASLLAHRGEPWTEAWLRGVKANLAGKPSGGDRDQIGGVHAGKCDLAIANTYYLGVMQAKTSPAQQQAQAAAVRPLFPNVGDRGTHVSISGMALARHARNRDNAMLLMDFLVSEPAQFIYALDNNEYPVRTDVEASDLVKSWGVLKPDVIPLAKVAELTKKAVELVEKVGFDK